MAARFSCCAIRPSGSDLSRRRCLYVASWATWKSPLPVTNYFACSVFFVGRAKIGNTISKRLWNGKGARDSSGIIRARQGHTAHHFFAGEIREPTVRLQPTGECEHRR